MFMGSWPGIVLVVAACALGVWALIPDEAGNGANFMGESGSNPYQLERSAIQRLLFPVLRRVVGPIIKASPAGRLDALERQIALAGLSRRWTPERMLMVKFVLAVVFFVIGLALIVITGSGFGMLVLVVAPVAGFMAPELRMKQMATERQAEIQRQLPDIIDQFTIMVEAGITFDAAMARVAKGGGGGAVADEFARVVQDMGLGMSRREALDELLERTDVDELREFINAMNQADAHGLPVSRVLKVHANELRDKRRRRAEEHAMKIPAKILIPLIFCVLPALLAVVLGPGIVTVTSR